jgi:hypothetical protein
MTAVQDLSGTWSVAAFHRAIKLAHLDLERLIDRNNHHHESFVPAFTACGALPPGWPEAVARRLAWTMFQAEHFRDTPAYRDTFVTDAQGRLVYSDGWDDLRAWMEELGIGEDGLDAPGALRPLLEHVSMPTLVERLGPDRMAAFLTQLRQEGPALEHVTGWVVRVTPAEQRAFIGHYVGQVAALGRCAGLKYENVALLAQAHRDAALAQRIRASRPEWVREGPDAPPALE